MFRVKLGSITSNSAVTIHDEHTDLNVLTRATVDIEVNKPGSFKFTMLPSHPYYDSIVLKNSIIDVYQGEDIIFSGIVSAVSVDFYKQKTVTCEGMLASFADTVQRPGTFQGDVGSTFNTIINSHNLEVLSGQKIYRGTVSSDIASKSYEFDVNMQSSLDVLRTLQKAFGGFMFVRKDATDGKLYIDWLSSPIRQNKQAVKIGSNLMDFNKNSNYIDLCSRLIPLGYELPNTSIKGMRLTIEDVNSGLDYLTTGITNIGTVYRTMVFDDVEDAQTLKERGLEAVGLMAAENICVEVKAFDLSISSEAFDSFRVLDSVQIISSPHGIDDWYPLTRQKININEPSKNTITLGINAQRTISELVKGV